MVDTLITRDTVIVSVCGAYDKPLTSGLIAGEALDAASPIYVKSDGMCYMSYKTAVDDATSGNPKYVGFCNRAVAVNKPVELFGAGTLIHYAASGLTPGAALYLSDTKGRLTTDAEILSADPAAGVKILKHQKVAVVWDAKTILVTR